jgi:hypothetical protein
VIRLLVIKLAAVAVKRPVVAPVVINRAEGTLRLALLLLIESTVHPTDVLFSVTVHVLEEPPVKLTGAQLTEVGTTGGTSPIVILLELLPRSAVTVADWLLEKVVVVAALKVAEVAAGATVTDVGTVRVELVLIRVTMAPEGAGPLRLTVQVEAAKPFRVAGRQEREVTAGKAATTLTMPPVAASRMAFPEVEDATLLPIPIEAVVRPAAMVRVTTPTTPLEMIPAFIAEAMQVYVPEAPEQFNVLPAAVRAAPALTEIEATLAGR